MALSGIISVSGIPGLHKILSQTKNGLIVESLLDGKRRPIYSTQKVSSLEDISIYTMEEDMPLKDVFAKISEKESGKKALDHKSSPADLRAYLTEVVATVDHERVYNSDVAKLFQWYNLLVEKDLLNLEEEVEGAEEVKETKKAAPKKKAVTKPAATKKPAAAKKTTAKAASGKAKGTAKKP